MNEFQESVELFQKTFKGLAPAKPSLYPYVDEAENVRIHKLRVALLQEELDELEEALEDHDLVEVADAIGDILYLAFGAAVTYGIDIEPVFREIQRSNMSKLPADGIPLIRADGKIMKPETYSPPELAPIILAQINPLLMPGDEG